MPQWLRNLVGRRGDNDRSDSSRHRRFGGRQPSRTQPPPQRQQSQAPPAYTNPFTSNHPQAPPQPAQAPSRPVTPPERKVYHPDRVRADSAWDVSKAESGYWAARQRATKLSRTMSTNAGRRIRVAPNFPADHRAAPTHPDNIRDAIESVNQTIPIKRRIASSATVANSTQGRKRQQKAEDGITVLQRRLDLCESRLGELGLAVPVRPVSAGRS